MAFDDQNVTTLDSFYVYHADNYVDEAGSVALGEAMKTNTTLTELDLGSALLICEKSLNRTIVSKSFLLRKLREDSRHRYTQ